MADEMIVKELDQVVVRFSGDSGDGMQLAGNIFSNISATVGNDISTFPDYCGLVGQSIDVRIGLMAFGALKALSTVLRMTN
jgi:hypothetical protein